MNLTLPPMLLVAQILFWGSVLALAHSYVLYPLLMKWLSKGKRPNELVFDKDDAQLPAVSILMSVYNEEKVIAEKLDSLLRLDYPAGKLQIYIGSDCSDDATNQLVSQAASGSDLLHFYPFAQRRGKPPVINELAEYALQRVPAGPGHVFVLTDASVMLRSDTLYHLVRHYRNPAIGVVDAHMRSVGLRGEGISRSEDRYLSGEVQLKYREGLVWGQMIGPFGGCYALRSDLFEPVPPNSLVDDFWLVFRVLEKGFQAINDLDAVCYEGATHRVRDEFRRKKRIAAGSFQNLARFRRWVLPPMSTLGFAFFSHKVLRWFGGFLILLSWLACAFLAIDMAFYRWLLLLMTAGLAGIPLLDWLLSRLRFTFLPVKNLAYFLAMNAALIAGFFKWQKGIRENTWQRTTRY